jgi:hypothetical protein
VVLQNDDDQVVVVHIDENEGSIHLSHIVAQRILDG